MGRKKLPVEKVQTPKNGASGSGVPRTPSKKARSSGTPRGSYKGTGVAEIPLPPLIQRIGGLRDELQRYVVKPQSSRGPTEDGEIEDDRPIHRMSRSRSKSPPPQTARIHNSPPDTPRDSQDGRRGRVNRTRLSSSDDSDSTEDSDSSSSSSSSEERHKKKHRRKSKSSRRKRGKSKKAKKDKSRSRSRKGKKRKRSPSTSSSSDSSSSEDESPPPRRRRPIQVGKGKVGKHGSKGKSAGRRERTPSSDKRDPPALITDSEDSEDDVGSEDYNETGYDEDELDRLTARALAEVSRRANQPGPVDKNKSTSTPKQPTQQKAPAVTDTVDTTADDPMERALRIVQEAFEVESERGEPIHDAYARIVDGALR